MDFEIVEEIFVNFFAVTFELFKNVAWGVSQPVINE